MDTIELVALGAITLGVVGVGIVLAMLDNRIAKTAEDEPEKALGRRHTH